MRSGRSRKRLIVFLALLVEPVAMLLRGYPIGGNLVVRCRQGHLFTTLWIPGVSVKSVRFLWWRFQRCPVGHHWTIVTPVHEDELSRLEKRRARARHDVPIP